MRSANDAHVLKDVNASIEKIIRPIVEGQIRGFLKEHPSVLNGVDWYKPRDDKTVTFVNSLSKRIVRDLVCDSTRLRIKAALLKPCMMTQHHSDLGIVTETEAPNLEGPTGLGALIPANERLWT